MSARRAAAALVIAAGAAISASSASCATTSKTEAPDAGQPVLVGVSLALTGDNQGTGLPLQNAIKVAQQQVNAYGGVLGRPVNFQVLDDASDTGAVIQKNVRQLLDQGAVAILGPVGSGQVKAVADPALPGLTFQRKVIEISATATSPNLTTLQPPKDRYFFRTVPNDILQGKAAAIFAYRGPGSVDGGRINGCNRMAIVHNDDAYGDPFAASTTAEFQRRGGTLALDVKIPPAAQASYDAVVNQLVAAKPECLTMVVFAPAGDELVREVKAAQQANPGAFPSTFFIVGTDALYRNDFIVNGRTDKANPSSPTAVEGVYGTNPDSAPDTSQYGDFVNLYQASFPDAVANGDLASPVANFYDAAVLVALAVEKAGKTTDPVAIRDALFAVTRGGKSYGPQQVGDALAAIRNGQDIDYTGASGDCNFDDNGDVIGNYIIWQVVQGALKPIDRIKAADLTSP